MFSKKTRTAFHADGLRFPISGVLQGVLIRSQTGSQDLFSFDSSQKREKFCRKIRRKGRQHLQKIRAGYGIRISTDPV